MSKKSRKRNKKILAAIGIGLGAAALASRKKASDKADLAGTEDNKKGSTRITGGTNLNDYVTKKDTSKTDVKPIAKPESKTTGSKVRTRQRIVDSSGNTVESAGVKSKDVKGILPPSKNKGNMYAGVGDTNPRSRGYGKKDGGRMGLKSGGSSGKKSMGKALRGGGKVMR